MERIGPPIDQLFHQLDSLLVRRWDVQGLLSASEALPVWPAQQDLAFVGVGIIPCITCRGVEEGKPHEGIRHWIAALEEEGVEIAHREREMPRVHDACAQQPHGKDIVEGE